MLSRLRTELLTSSIRLEDVRRVGKTWIMKELADLSEDDLQLVYIDVEGIATGGQFYERVYGALAEALPRKAHQAKAVTDFLSKSEGLQVGSIKLPAVKEQDWPLKLDQLLVGYSECFPLAISVVVAFDELPWAVDSIADKDPAQAEQLLGLLRSLRSRFPRLKMIYCGSIGFHHIIQKLVKKGFAADPFSGMHSISVGPMSPIESSQLAEQLMLGEGVYAAGDVQIHEYIATSVGGFPFYIQNVVSYLARMPKTDTGVIKENVEQAVAEILNSPEDNFRFRTYADRLVAHQGGQVARACERILDEVAGQEEPISSKDLESILAADPVFRESAFRVSGREVFSRPDYLDTFKILELDKYLVRGQDSMISFSFELFRQAWRLMRHL